MDNKLIKWLRIIGLAVCLGIGTVQLSCAICWAWKNGSNIQDFFDTGIYLSNAVNMCSDGWRLPGYACILKWFMGFEGVFGKNYIILLYLFQTVCSLLCFAEGFRCVGRAVFGCSVPFYKALLPAGYILTLPIVWQMQFAVLPDALCLSLVVLVTAQMISLIVKPDKRNWPSYLLVGGGVVIIGLLEHHYFYGVLCFLMLNALVLLLRFLCSKCRTKERLWQAMIVLLLAICIPLLTDRVNASVPKTDHYTSYSLEAELLSRFVYPNLSADYSSYSDAVKDVLPEESLQNINFYELYFREAGVQMEENYEGDVSALFADMAVTGLTLRTGEIAAGTAKEVALYTFIPLAMVKNMYSNGNSLYGHNYTKMYEVSPKLTADYMHAGMNGFLVVTIMAILMGVVHFIITKKNMKKKLLGTVYGLFSVWSITLPMMLLSIMKFDYRIGLFSVYMWGIFAVWYLYMMLDDMQSEKHS